MNSNNGTNASSNDHPFGIIIYCLVLSKVTQPLTPATTRIITKMDTHPKSIVNESIVTGQMRGSSIEVLLPNKEIINEIRYISTRRDTKHENTAFTVWKILGPSFTIKNSFPIGTIGIRERWLFRQFRCHGPLMSTRLKIQHLCYN